MKDVENSLKKASIRDQWIFGERMNRIGDPFKWVDGDQIHQLQGLSGGLAFLQFLAMSGEIYDTPEEIRTSDYLEMYERIRKRLIDAFDYFCPFSSIEELNFQKYIQNLRQ